MKLFRLLTVLLLSVAVVFSLSCRREPQGRCGRLIKDLQNPQKAKDSIRQLGQKQGEKSCAKAIPELAKMFKEGRYPEDILLTIKNIGKVEATQYPETLALLRDAIKSDETYTLATTVVEDWKLSEMKEDLVKVLTSDEAPKARCGAVKALLSFSKPEEVEDTLVALVIGDPDKQGLRVNVAAAQELARIRSVKAVPNLVKALFLRDQRGGEMYQVARLALARIGGTPVRDILVATLKGENQELREYGRANGIQDWEWADGPKIPQVLADLGDPTAAPAVAENLGKKLVEPAGITEAALETWKMTQSNRITIGMLTVARLGDDAVVAPLVATISDSMNDFKQRMDSASALAALGTPASVDALFKVYEESKDERFRAPMLRPLTLALDTAHLVKFDELMALEEKNKAELVLARVKGLESEPADPIVLGCIDVVRKCVNEDTACLIGELNAEPEKAADGTVDELASARAQARQWKAVVMLGRKAADADAVIPELLKKFKETPQESTDIRNYALISLERIGRNNAKVFEGLKAILGPGAELSPADIGQRCNPNPLEKRRTGNPFWNMELESRIIAFEARQAATTAGAPK